MACLLGVILEPDYYGPDDGVMPAGNTGRSREGAETRRVRKGAKILLKQKILRLQEDFYH